MISVIGGEACGPEALTTAEAGRECSRATVCGGRGGVMEAACRCARPKAATRSASCPAAATRTRPEPVRRVPVFTGMGSPATSWSCSRRRRHRHRRLIRHLSEISYALIRPGRRHRHVDFSYRGFDGDSITRVSDAAEAVDTPSLRRRAAFVTQIDMSDNRSIHAREVLDSRGNPTVAATVTLASGASGSSVVPGRVDGHPRGARAARQGPERHGGKGVLQAVANVNDKIGPKRRNVHQRPACAGRSDDRPRRHAQQGQPRR